MTLEDRIERLERGNRRWRALACGLAAVLVVIILLGSEAGEDNVVVATEFRLVDGDGVVRAKLGLTETGGPGLSLLDQRGKVRAQFAVVESGMAGPGDDGVASTLWLSGATIDPAVMLVAGSNVRMLQVNDLQGCARAQIKVGQYGAPVLTRASLDLMDADGNRCLRIGTEPVGMPRPADRQEPAVSGDAVMGSWPHITLMDHHQQVRVRFAVWGDGEPSLDLWDRSGDPVLSVPDVGKPTDADGEPR
jgi:hypothetical protein